MRTWEDLDDLLSKEEEQEQEDDDDDKEDCSQIVLRT